MTRFKGFSDGKINITMVHAQFISEVVPMIGDLAELKVCLYCYYALAQKEGQYRYLMREDFVNNPELMEGLKSLSDNVESVLDSALDKALEHGFLLSKGILIDGRHASLYFMNTSKSKVMMDERTGSSRPRVAHASSGMQAHQSPVSSTVNGTANEWAPSPPNSTSTRADKT